MMLKQKLKIYKKPILKIHGHLKDITESGGGGVPDGGVTELSPS